MTEAAQPQHNIVEAFDNLFRRHSKALFGENGIIEASVTPIYSHAPVNLHESDWPEANAKKLRYIFKFKRPNGSTPSADEVLTVFQTIGAEVPEIKDVYHAFISHPLFRKQVDALKADFPPNENSAAGLSVAEYEALEKWKGAKAYKRGGGEVIGSTDTPIMINYEFDNKADADLAKRNLTVRADEILKQVVAQASASSYLTPEQKEQLSKVTISAKEIAFGDGGMVQLVMGIPAADGQKDEQGNVIIKSSPLNDLLISTEKTPDGKIVGEEWKTILAHDPVFTGAKTTPEGTGWLDAFHLLAGPPEIKKYLEFRINPPKNPDGTDNPNGLQNESLKTAIRGILLNDKFLPEAALKERIEHAQANFGIRFASVEHPHSTKLSITFPEKGLTQEQFEAAIIRAATQQQAVANDTGAPVLGPHTAALAQQQAAPLFNQVVGDATGRLAQAAANDQPALGRTA